MSKVDRNNPKRSRASESDYTIFEFEREFPNDATCLEYLVSKFYPEGIFCPTCEKVTKHHRDRSRPSFCCQFCGHREHPLVGTIFEKSATSLKLWFYAIYLMSSTRCGISAKQLERELGVTYKTAWRMFNRIRSLLSDDGEFSLSGTVEMDETYIGGRPRLGEIKKRQDIRAFGERKQKVFGMVERKGRVVARVVPDSKASTLMRHVTTRVLPEAVVYTDEFKSYRGLPKHGYTHKRIHHAAKVYVDGDVHTQTIEGFWSLLKRGIGGVYHSVSATHLQSYLDEYAFRYNNRERGTRSMFNAFLGRVRKASAAS